MVQWEAPWQQRNGKYDEEPIFQVPAVDWLHQPFCESNHDYRHVSTRSLPQLQSWVFRSISANRASPHTTGLRSRTKLRTASFLDTCVPGNVSAPLVGGEPEASIHHKLEGINVDLLFQPHMEMATTGQSAVLNVDRLIQGCSSEELKNLESPTVFKSCSYRSCLITNKLFDNEQHHHQQCKEINPFAHLTSNHFHS